MQDLYDKQMITEVIYLYCRGLDRCDLSIFDRVYHDDATEDRGKGVFIGKARDMVETALSVLETKYASTQHFIGNILINLDSDKADSESYFQAYHRRKDRQNQQSAEPAMEFVMAGRYLDRFEKRNGIWKIAHRKMFVDWTHSRRVEETWFEKNPGANRSQRGLKD